MISRYTKLRIRRKIRTQKKSLEKAGEQASDQFESQVADRWRNFRDVQRFVGGWLILVTLLMLGVFLQSRELSSYYISEVSIPGGTFREGVVGRISNVNPIFAANAADRAAAALQFNGLFTYDQNNKIVGDLATGFELNEDGTVYTISLRDNVTWHDGEQFDAEDVVFTYEAIQHPDTRSFLSSSWRDVKVQIKDEFTVTFALPNRFVPFVHSLTEGGIIPEHILGDTDPSQLRGADFNAANPVGTGPFMFDELLVETTDTTTSEQLRLVANDDYFGGDVQLDRFVLTTFEDREALVDSFLAGDLAAAGGLTNDDRGQLVTNLDSQWYDLPLNNGVFLFYNNSNSILKDASVRVALSRAIDQAVIHAAVDNRYQLISGPILPNQFGYDEDEAQVPYSPDIANKALEKAGWKYRTGDQNDGFRYKDGKKFTLSLVTESSDDYPDVAGEVRRLWAEVGVEADVLAASEADIQQNNIAAHNYDVLLFGIALGADPDSFVYWHSSQSGVNGFNLSEIEDDILDEALASGRTRKSPATRAAKYQTFQDRWAKVAPAHAMYRPGYGYVQRNTVNGFEEGFINSPEQRYATVHNWMINTGDGVRPY